MEHSTATLIHMGLAVYIDGREGSEYSSRDEDVGKA